MTTRTNFVSAFPITQRLPQLAMRCLDCFSAKVERWQSVGRHEAIDIEEEALSKELSDGLVVLMVTNREPDVRAHLSKMGSFNVLTVSINCYDKEWISRAAMDAVNLNPEMVLAGVGEEAELELDENGLPFFVGENVRILR